MKLNPCEIQRVNPALVIFVFQDISVYNKYTKNRHSYVREIKKHTKYYYKIP